MRPSPRHFTLIKRGLALHERWKYRSALAYFEQAHGLAPGCPFAIYNRANTLYMLSRDEEAYGLLHRITDVTFIELVSGCPDSLQSPRSCQLDAHYLLFHVVLGWKGFCEEAFAHAELHLQLRTRGLGSVWSMREVRKEIDDLMRRWRGSRGEQRPRCRKTALPSPSLGRSL